MKKNIIFVICFFTVIFSSFVSANGFLDEDGDGYDDKTGWNNDKTFNFKTGEVISGGTVPSDYNGPIKLSIGEGEASGTLIIGGETYNVASGAKIIVSNGEIVSFQGKLLSPANLGGNIVSGNIFSYSNGVYGFRGEEATLNNVPIANSRVSVSEKGIIQGVAGFGSRVANVGFKQGSRIYYDPNKKEVVVDEDTVITEIGENFEGTINTNGKETLLPNAVPINGKLSFMVIDGKQAAYVEAGDRLKYGKYEFHKLPNDVYILSDKPPENFKNAYVVIKDGNLAGGKTQSGTSIKLRVLPGNELFNTFKTWGLSSTEIDPKTGRPIHAESGPDKKDHLVINVKNGDGFEVEDRGEETPLFTHISSASGETEISDGEIPITLTQQGIHLDVGPSSDFYRNMGKILPNEEYLAHIEKLKESVAMEIVSDAVNAKNMVLRIGSANSFVFYDKQEDSPRLIFDSAGLPVSKLKRDNQIQTVFDLWREFHGMDFEYRGGSPFLIQTAYYWLKKDYLGAVSQNKIKDVVLNPGQTTFANSGMISIGEMTMRRPYVGHRYYDSQFQILDHEYTHVSDIALGELESKGRDEISYLVGDVAGYPLYAHYEQLMNQMENGLRRNPESVNGVLGSMHQYLQDLSPEERKQLQQDAKLFFDSRNPETYFDMYEDPTKISGERLLSDLQKSLKGMLEGKYDGPYEHWQVQDSILAFSLDEIRNPTLDALSRDLTTALENTIGIEIYYSLRNPYEFSATLADRPDEKIAKWINFGNGFVKGITLERLQIGYDSGSFSTERYVGLMNSQTPGCTPGNCFCDIPGNCGKCLVYKRVCEAG
ncbi:hypothetical protein CMO93_01610 [Candidatus Woesearchaeota archaeon]|nr:hypothetical protein [Candidatus Woesearchaeota archaeon]|tara:strand:+ start:1376 stop:3847 length:2472 start_codon:yes stop_codon:yes gene_type:complete